MSTQALYAEALRHHQAGRLAEAEQIYRRILEVDSNHADSLLLLGLIAYQVGQSDAAIALITKALAINPIAAPYHSNLGAVLLSRGRTDEAVGSYAIAIALQPDFADPYCNMGVALRTKSVLRQAMAASRAAVRIRPDWPEAQLNFGKALAGLGRYDDAIAAYHAALHYRANWPEAHNALGGALSRLGRLDEAISAYSAAIRSSPNSAEFHCDLGIAFWSRGRLNEAVAALQTAIRINPKLAQAHSNLGNALRDLGRSQEAGESFRAALQLRPDFVEAHSNLGNALVDLGRLDAAIAAYEAAICLRPDYAEAYSNRGNALKDLGCAEMALGSYAHAIALVPDFVLARSNRLFAMYFVSGFPIQSILSEALEFGRRFDREITRPFANSADAERRLRIGYVSPDFRTHSIAQFIEPVLRAHDRKALDVFCYSEVRNPDRVTQRLQALADHWVTTAGLSDETLAERIQADDIDILVDLAGHTANHRLLVFARKPAPVQVNWLGDPGTTGLRSIDYRLVDGITDPETDRQVTASETLFRLPDAFLCYGLPTGPAEAPARLAQGPLTLGSFNNPAKLSVAVFDAWTAILERLPQSKLLLKGATFGSEVGRNLILDRFASRGIAPQRIELLAPTARADDHLALYRRLDIALDPFPYNGATTTCEALWMGVPVVALRGTRFSARIGASLLTQVGLDALIGETVEDYIEIAIALADDAALRAELRRSLRTRIAASPLSDAPRFTLALEAAYRTMWRNWCAGSS